MNLWRWLSRGFGFAARFDDIGRNFQLLKLDFGKTQKMALPFDSFRVTWYAPAGAALLFAYLGLDLRPMIKCAILLWPSR